MVYKKLVNAAEIILKGNYGYLRNEIESGKKIIIYGSGKHSRDVFSLLEKYKLSKAVLAFCDDFNKDPNREVCGCKVLNYYEIIREYGNQNICFYVSGQYENEIKERLSNRKETRIFEFHPAHTWVESIVANKEVAELTQENNIDVPSSNIYYFVQKCNELYRGLQFEQSIERVYNLMSDKFSIKVIRNRLNLLLNGDINCLSEIVSNEIPYFDSAYYRMSEHEIYVDGGGYTGDTLLQFVGITKGKYDKIIVFEPDYKNYITLNRTILENNINAVSYLAATGEKKGKISFSESGSEASCLGTGDGMVNVERMDDLMLDAGITFIKLDVEGSELSTLKGAAQIIQKNKPKLAVCIYHRPEDIYEIPLYIHNLVPEYRFKVRHYNYNHWDTVLYCEADSNSK